jgi:hypothetical protein
METGTEGGHLLIIRLGIILGCFLGGLAAALAEEADFLDSLEGQWAGKGSVKVRVASPTIPVTCKFTSNAGSDSLALDGHCRGLLVFSRRISATLKGKEGSYSGTYIGAGTGPAVLDGVRKGSAIDLGITWAKPVNGDRKATMTLEKTGESGMTLITTDVDPRSGKSVVTSRIELKRVQ